MSLGTSAEDRLSASPIATNCTMEPCAPPVDAKKCSLDVGAGQCPGRTHVCGKEDPFEQSIAFIAHTIAIAHTTHTPHTTQMPGNKHFGTGVAASHVFVPWCCCILISIRNPPSLRLCHTSHFAVFTPLVSTSSSSSSSHPSSSLDCRCRLHCLGRLTLPPPSAPLCPSNPQNSSLSLARPPIDRILPPTLSLSAAPSPSPARSLFLSSRPVFALSFFLSRTHARSLSDPLLPPFPWTLPTLPAKQRAVVTG